MEQELSVTEFQQRLNALKKRFNLPDVNTEELMQAYQSQIKKGGYLFNGHHNNQHINKYLLNLDSNNQSIEYDPSLITFMVQEVYNYDGIDFTRQEIKKQFPNLFCGSQEDLLSYMRYHLKGITQMETFMLNQSSFNVSFFHTERVHLNMGPSDLIWILSESNPKNWNGDLEYFYLNHIPINVIIQKANTLMVLPPGFYVAMKCSQEAVLISWSILRRNLNTLQTAIKYSERRCSSDCYLPFPTLILDILNHEVKTLPEELKNFLKATLKKYFDEANAKFNERITKHKINGRPPKIFQDYVVGVCETCKKDLFMHYYVSRGHNYCLDCMEIQITSSMNHYPIKYIYASWQPFVVLTSAYSDRMKHQGCIKLICANTYVGHVDHGVAINTMVNESQIVKASSQSKNKQPLETNERKNKVKQKSATEDNTKKNSKDVSQQQSMNQSREQVIKKQPVGAEIMQMLEEDNNLDQPVLKKKQKHSQQ